MSELYASGVQTLAAPAVNAAYNPLASTFQWTTIAQWQADDPRPCELGCVVRVPGNVLPQNGLVYFPDLGPLFFCGFTVGGGGGETSRGEATGAFLITYGRKGVQRRLICDLRTQRVFLGACSFVRVEAARWATVASQFTQGAIEVGADINDAVGGDYDEPTATMLRRYAAGVAIAGSTFAPQGAKWWTPIVNTYSAGDEFWGGTTPPIWWESGCQSVVVDAANYRWVPPLARFELSLGADGTFISHTSNGALTTIPLWVGQRFYLST